MLTSVLLATSSVIFDVNSFNPVLGSIESLEYSNIKSSSPSAMSARIDALVPVLMEALDERPPDLFWKTAVSGMVSDLTKLLAVESASIVKSFGFLAIAVVLLTVRSFLRSPFPLNKLRKKEAMAVLRRTGLGVSSKVDYFIYLLRNYIMPLHR